MKRLLYLFALPAIVALVLAPAAVAQDQFNCDPAVFPFQEDAQAVYDS